MLQRNVGIPLGSIKTYSTLSGYIYLHLPQYLCKQFGITSATQFSISYRDGKIIIEQAEAKKEG